MEITLTQTSLRSRTHTSAQTSCDHFNSIEHPLLQHRSIIALLYWLFSPVVIIHMSLISTQKWNNAIVLSMQPDTQGFAKNIIYTLNMGVNTRLRVFFKETREQKTSHTLCVLPYGYTPNIDV